MSLLKLSHVSAFMGRNGMGEMTTVKVICRMPINRGGKVVSTTARAP